MSACPVVVLVYIVVLVSVLVLLVSVLVLLQSVLVLLVSVLVLLQSGLVLLLSVLVLDQSGLVLREVCSSPVCECPSFACDHAIVLVSMQVMRWQKCLMILTSLRHQIPVASIASIVHCIRMFVPLPV